MCTIILTLNLKQSSRHRHVHNDDTSLLTWQQPKPSYGGTSVLESSTGNQTQGNSNSKDYTMPCNSNSNSNSNRQLKSQCNSNGNSKRLPCNGNSNYTYVIGTAV